MGDSFLDLSFSDEGGISDIEISEDPIFTTSTSRALIPYQPKNPVLIQILSTPTGDQTQKNEEDPKKKSTQRKRKSIAPKKNQKGEGDESNWAHKKNQRKTGLAGLSQSLRDDGRKRAKMNCLPKGPFQKASTSCLIF